MDWKTLSPEQMEAVYNPRANVSDLPATMARAEQKSAVARNALGQTAHVSEDLRYGTGPLCTLDLYQPLKTSDAPRRLFMFIHGGYWRGRDKRDYSFVVPPLLATNAVVANVNYDLCPSVTLDEIVRQAIQAVRFCHSNATRWAADPDQITLVGHSAGAHLAARVLNTPADNLGTPAHCLASIIGISGVYEPQVILPISVNKEAQISEQSAIANDCIANPPQLADARKPKVSLWAGGDEPHGWIEQTKRYASMLRETGIACADHVVTGCDHFSILDNSFLPDSTEFGLIVGGI